MKPNESGQSKGKGHQMNPTHEARALWVERQGVIVLVVRLAPLSYWWWIDTRIGCGHWCESEKELMEN